MRHFIVKKALYGLFIPIILVLCGCSSQKFLGEDEHVLSDVRLVSDAQYIRTSDYRKYVRQEPNAKWFNAVKVPLGLYCVSGKNEKKWINRFFRRIGQAPEIYDSTKTANSLASIQLAMQNSGYLSASVSKQVNYHRHKAMVTYKLVPRQQYTIKSFTMKSDNANIDSIVKADSTSSLIHLGMPCDINVLDSERKRIVSRLQNLGYYNFHKEFISYSIDSCRNSKELDLTLWITRGNSTDSQVYDRYKMRNVRVYTNIEMNEVASDSITSNNIKIFFKNRLPLRKHSLSQNIEIKPGEIFSDKNIQRTYSKLDGLQAIQYATIKMQRTDSAMLDCDINIQTNKPNAISLELEGTNTAGDLGAAASVSFSNKNVFRGSELFTFKLKGAFEAITGLEGYSDANYIELNAEASLKFPGFIMPLLSEKFRKNIKAQSEISLLYSNQNRPEFHRRIFTGTWGYKWHNINKHIQHKFDVVSLNYVFMPWISDTFRKDYLEGDSSRNSILKYSYENLFIMKMGYSFVYNSSKLNASGNTFQTNAYQIRFNVESAGNLLDLIAHSLNTKRDEQGQYTLFNIAYAQYAKADFDFTKSFLIDERNSIALHAGFGIALPYGNSNIVPYEKRYFSGGANSVRGWSVRELGPGSFHGQNGRIDFINQTGNIKLDLNFEYRSLLFWKLHGALFVDAGNIWTTKKYTDQPGGEFRFNKFYEQIALAYGLGLRFNMDYFILRLDFGMKAINPSYTDKKRHYPIFNPSLNRDLTFHFAVGLPF